jgi:hypothetical protein
MSNADASPRSLAYAMGSDLLLGVGFAVLALGSAMRPAALLRPTSAPVVLVGMGLVLSGGMLRILAGETLPTVGGDRYG